MGILLKGVLLGFSLSFLVGPLLFALVQSSLEKGVRAGLSLAAGIWASDVLFVVAVLFFVERIRGLTAGPLFAREAGLVGGLLLIGFGAANFLGKARPPKFQTDSTGLTKRPNLFAQFSKGFLVNSVNPFTVFFWLGITGTVVAPNGWGVRESLVFFGGMLGTLVATDTAKVFLCQKIGRWLTERHVRQVRLAVGAGLIAFGIALIFRTL